jgi:hypothetical protein
MNVATRLFGSVGRVLCSITTSARLRDLTSPEKYNQNILHEYVSCSIHADNYRVTACLANALSPPDRDC